MIASPSILSEDPGSPRLAELTIGRIVSVTGSKAIVLLDGGSPAARHRQARQSCCSSGQKWARCSASIPPTLSCSPSSRRSPFRRPRNAKATLKSGSPNSASSANSGARATVARPRSTAASRSIQHSAIAFASPRSPNLKWPLSATRKRFCPRWRHPPGRHHSGHGQGRRSARQALRHSRHHGHRQILHHGADPARDPATEPGSPPCACLIPITSMRRRSRSGAKSSRRATCSCPTGC